jgi:hypothetical protein
MTLVEAVFLNAYPLASHNKTILSCLHRGSHIEGFPYTMSLTQNCNCSFDPNILELVKATLRVIYLDNATFYIVVWRK